MQNLTKKLSRLHHWILLLVVKISVIKQLSNTKSLATYILPHTLSPLKTEALCWNSLSVIINSKHC